MVYNSLHILTLRGYLAKYFKINHYMYFKGILSTGQSVFLNCQCLIAGLHLDAFEVIRKYKEDRNSDIKI